MLYSQIALFYTRPQKPTSYALTSTYKNRFYSVSPLSILSCHHKTQCLYLYIFLCLATPARSNRGPFCYDCDHVGRVEDCHRLTLCRSDQVCSAFLIDQFSSVTSALTTNVVLNERNLEEGQASGIHISDKLCILAFVKGFPGFTSFNQPFGHTRASITDTKESITLHYSLRFDLSFCENVEQRSYQYHLFNKVFIYNCLSIVINVNIIICD